MRTYKKYLLKLFLTSFLYVSSVILSLILILNILTELDFFREINVSTFYPIYLAFLNMPSLFFEIFPFIFLLSSQFFFVKIFKENQIDIFKYFGLKNTKIIKFIAIISLILGFFIIVFFYNFSSNLKNFYLNLKSNYTKDNKYLAVITKNGLWIKDKIDNKIIILNSLEIDGKFLINNFISMFNEKNEIIQNINSPKINIEKNVWEVYDATIFKDNSKNFYKVVNLESNFNFEMIQNLFTELSSLSILELFKLKKNYEILGYSVTEVNIHILKILTFPIYLFLIVLFASTIMLRLKKIKNNTFKISVGLFLSVIIYYINNFFYVFGTVERIPFFMSILAPLLIMLILNFLLLYRINDK